MNTHPLLKVEMTHLSVAERIQLAEDLWDSIIDNPEELPLTNGQQEELDRRLEQYEQDPTSGTDWATVKSRLGLRNDK